MLKQTSRKIVLFLSLAALSNLSFAASEAHYGLPSKTKSALTANASYDAPVVLYNNTYDTYWAYATFKPTNGISNLFVGSYGSGRDVITYNINYPDNEVCVNVIRDRDQLSVFDRCVPPGFDINIGGPYNKTSNKVEVKITRTKA